MEGVLVTNSLGEQAIWDGKNLHPVQDLNAPKAPTPQIRIEPGAKVSPKDIEAGLLGRTEAINRPDLPPAPDAPQPASKPKPMAFTPSAPSPESGVIVTNSKGQKAWWDGKQIMPIPPDVMRAETAKIQDMGKTLQEGRTALEGPPPEERVQQVQKELSRGLKTPKTGGPDWTIPNMVTDVAVSLAPGGAVMRGLLGGANAAVQGKDIKGIATDAAVNAIPGMAIAGGKAVLREASHYASPAIMQAAQRAIGPDALGSLMQNMPSIIKHVGTYLGLSHHLPATLGAAVLGSIVKLGKPGMALAKQLSTPGAGQGTSKAISALAHIVKDSGLLEKEENGNNSIR